MIEVARDIVKYIGFLIKARRQAGEVAELEAWHQFVLAAIQTKTGGRSDIEVEVPYSYVRDYARSYGAPYTSCQKVKEAFDALVTLGYISRVKAGSSAPIKYRQYVFHVDPDSILMGSRSSGGSRTSEQEDAVI